MHDSAPASILVTGGSGLLGGATLAQLSRAAAAGGLRLTATWAHAAPAPDPGATIAWRRFDLCDPDAARALCGAARPRAIVHAAIPHRPAEAREGIAHGSARLARAAAACGAAFIHVSSDMVFDGAHGPFAEDAPLSPLTEYGRAKAAAERAVRAEHAEAFIVRSSLLYRLDPPDRALAAWLSGIDAGTAYPLFEDELRCPAPAADVGRALAELALVAAGVAGASRPLAAPGARTFHAVGPRAVSRWAFGTAVLRAKGRDPAGARRARLEGSGLVRPRALVLTRARTPGWLVEAIRDPSVALGVPVSGP